MKITQKVLRAAVQSSLNLACDHEPHNLCIQVGFSMGSSSSGGREGSGQASPLDFIPWHLVTTWEDTRVLAPISSFDKQGGENDEGNALPEFCDLGLAQGYAMSSDSLSFY